MTDELFEQSIRQIRRGDKDGLKQIYEAYIAFIYSVVFAVVKNKESAEDVTSEFFIKLWTTVAEQYRFGEKHRAYLARIAHNMAIDHLRRNQREQATDEIQEAVDAGAAAASAGKQQEAVEDSVVEAITVKEAIETLKEPEQQVLNMKIFGELTFAEIAQILKLPMGTVTWRYRTAIQKLQKSHYGKEVRQ